ncbi:MAG: sulfatase-like hydrolase/transferase, partial [Saprospiraceae bacterium]|nr:sulfatase-like hydrolase/transferase [Saprospiraceae bacterium]
MKEFTKRVRGGIYYLLFWVGYFSICRIVFLIYFHQQTSALSVGTILGVCLQGIKLDVSMAAYLSVIPFLILVLSIWISGKAARRMLRIYTFPLIFLVHFLMMFDLGLYGAWAIRLDSTPFIYLDTPQEMFASIAVPVLALGVIVWVISSLLVIFLFNRVINRHFFDFQPISYFYSPLLLGVTSLLIILMRGGFQTIPINQSSVYVFEEMFANHAAINFAWNFSHSIKSKSYSLENPFQRMEERSARVLVENANRPLQEDSTRLVHNSILRNKRPNIILIIWESLTAKIVEPLGGEPGVTENLNLLANEGILFDRFYANGDRSDKGLVAIFSGYYPQPDKSIMKIPAKSRSLPMFTLRLASLGYEKSFYYGGDLNFGNMNSFFRQGGMTELIDENQFAASDQNSKWGVHDHIVFERLKEDLTVETEAPFFKTIFTLSSHEPFEFPGEYKFGNDSEINSFRSAHAYTDVAVGDFVQWCKDQTWWDNTLIIITADHGHKLPQHEGPFNGSLKYQVPMLWLGGALKSEPVRVDHI